MRVSPPRLHLATLPTPVVRASRLEQALGSGPVYVKRDDLTGFGLSGNKARPLEFLLGAAVAEGCDVFVAAGSPTSNFCAAAAMAARVAGLDCDLLFPGDEPGERSTNIELARAAGARLVFGTVPTREQLDDAVRRHAQDLRAQGRRPYAVPRGGATGTGALGYACAVRELAEQWDALALTPRTVVVATGSGGTQAGLLAGRAGLGLPWHLVGASVSRPAEVAAAQVLAVSREAAAILGLEPPAPADVDVRDCRGAGFGVASDEDRVSAHLALVHEGLLLDDHYGAKAMTLARSLLDSGVETPLLFWHTGGTAAALAALGGPVTGGEAP
jgi:D-cysteine desulfhydrase